MEQQATPTATENTQGTPRKRNLRKYPKWMSLDWSIELSNRIIEWQQAAPGSDSVHKYLAILSFIEQSAPVAEQADEPISEKITARAALDYLIKEYALDQPTKERIYAGEFEGEKYEVVVRRRKELKCTCDPAAGEACSDCPPDQLVDANKMVCPAPEPAVAPKGVVEELGSAAFNWVVTFGRRIQGRVTGAELKASRLAFEAALSRVTELPEPKDRWKGQVSHVVVHLKDGQTLTSGLDADTFLHDISAALRDSALLAANPAKEGK